MLYYTYVGVIINTAQRVGTRAASAVRAAAVRPRPPVALFITLPENTEQRDRSELVAY